MVTQTKNNSLIASQQPMYDNRMQQKSNNKNHSSSKKSSPSNMQRGHSHHKKVLNGTPTNGHHQPVAKKSLNYYSTPAKNKASHTHSLPSTPISIPQAPSPSSRSSATPSPKCSLFAGSKCYEPPTPQSLPRPPTSWTGGKRPNMQDLVSSMQREEQLKSDSRDTNEEFSRHLKLMLKVET